MSPLVDVEALAGELAGPRPPTVLDVRWRIPELRADRAGYLAGHIPGSRFVDLDAELAAPPGGADGGRHPLPDAAAFSEVMCGHGVRGSYPVVVLDAAAGLAAVRAWWLLQYFGHDDVRLLDGGFAAWQAGGRPVEVGEPDVASVGDFNAVPGHLPVLDAAAAGALARTGVLLDARSASRYAGEPNPIDAVPGHIPGAVSMPATQNTDAEGRWLDPADLRARFADVLAQAGPVGVSCGSGVTACHNAFALRLMGEPMPALYVGSWSEWSARPDAAIATGSHPG